MHLYFGAGMAVYDVLDKIGDPYERSKSRKGPLGLLGHALSSRGISNLRLYEGLSVETLKSVVQLLDAYKHEIVHNAKQVDPESHAYQYTIDSKEY